MRTTLIIALALLATGCSNAPDSSTEMAGQAAISAETMAQWSRSCALCHVNGEGGAPVAGDAEAWAPRLVQGEALLLQHTIEGLNNMPPLGYCMDCEGADFKQMIRFMGGES